MLLAGYIGVLKKPENVRSESVAMTAPVVMGASSSRSAAEPIAMTAPVIMGSAGAERKEYMHFILPSKYSLETAPKATDPRVELVEQPARTCAVLRFSGSLRQPWIDQKGEELLAAVRADGALTPELADSEKPWFWGGFNPPWTPPLLRTNEVYIDVRETSR
jgi:hypothetical protein